MAWKKAKRGPKVYRRWGKNPRSVDTGRARINKPISSSMTLVPVGEHKVDGKVHVVFGRRDSGAFGGAVLYRDHLASQGMVKETRGGIIRNRYQHLPETLNLALSSYEGLPDDRVPPVIAVMRRREELIQSDRRQFVRRWTVSTLINGTHYKLFLFLSEGQAYFVGQDLLEGWIKKSCLLKAERARKLIQTGPKFERSITWVDRVDLPEPQVTPLEP